MRNNIPVTNNEYILTEKDSIVSNTDLQGNITYINDDFLRISQFTEAELMGQPQNIVRHPDMPAEAFADFWADIKNGKPWTGLVKNRCKNGDFYWVKANVTPILENGQHVGYMSVRTAASRSDIETTSAVYSLFKQGKQGGLKIIHGQPVSPSWQDKLNFLHNISIKKRISAMFMLMAFVLLGGGIIGVSVNNQTNNTLNELYNNHMTAQNELISLQHKWHESSDLLQAALSPKNTQDLQSVSEQLSENLNIIKALQAKYAMHSFTPAQLSENKTLEKLSKKLLDGVYSPAELLIYDGDTKPLQALLKVSARQMPALQEQIEKAIVQNMNTAESLYQQSTSSFINMSLFMLVSTVTVIVIAFVVSVKLSKSITEPLDRAIGYFRELSQGNYGIDVEAGNDDEVGRVLEALKMMQIKLGFEVEDMKRLANESTRIKIGLDNVSTNVMIADNNRNIIYMNNSIVPMLSNAQDDIRKELPNFDVEKLMGSNIDLFHKHPEHQKKLLASFTSEYRAEIEVGGRTFLLVANPVINVHGDRLGSVIEWTDRTAEVVIEKEVASIVNGAVQGDFTRRMSLEGKDKFFTQLCEAVNRLMETSEKGLNEVVRMLSALAKGDLTDRITNEYQGTFGQLKDDSNLTANKLKEIVLQIKEAADTINVASKEIAMGNSDLSQRTEEQASSLEETAASMEELTTTVKQNAENAKQANKLANGASDIALKGGDVVGKVVNTMSDINDSSREIVDIISVIDGIAFQTNILALNAAVEAARAGEQGRGFAVVASEVRSLAQRSAAAAKEIKTLIGDSVDKVEAGAKLVDEAGNTMDEIVTAVKQVTDIMAEIATASMEQSSGIGQVSQAIMQMDEVTQQNAALVEEAAAAAESLEEQADTLSVSVSVFDTGDAAEHVLQTPLAADRKAHHRFHQIPKTPNDDEWTEF